MNKGFTLIELLIVFSIIGILSTIGVVSFIGFNRKQSLINSAEDIKTFLQRARTQTYSQISSQCPLGQHFKGYKFLLCCTVSGCPVCSSSSFSYELDIICGGTSLPVDGKPFPNGISIDNSTTSKTFLFNPISSSITGDTSGPSWQIVLNGFGSKKTITVYNTGVIQ